MGVEMTQEKVHFASVAVGFEVFDHSVQLVGAHISDVSSDFLSDGGDDRRSICNCFVHGRGGEVDVVVCVGMRSWGSGGRHIEI